METFSGILAWLSVLGLIIASILGAVNLSKHRSSKAGRKIAFVSVALLILAFFITNAVSDGFWITLSAFAALFGIFGLIGSAVLGLIHISKKQKSKTGRKTAMASAGILLFSILIVMFIPDSNSTQADHSNKSTHSKKDSSSDENELAKKQSEKKDKLASKLKAKQESKKKADKEAKEKAESIAKKNADEEKAKQESQAKAESKKQADKKKSDSEGKTVIELFDDMNDQEISKYNAGLAKELASDQQDAETVEAYAWSAFVDTTEYVKNRGFQVDVTSEFLTLNEKERKSVINSAQNFGTSEFLFMDKNLSENPGFTNTNIYYDGNRIGHSKLTDESDFKWTD